MNENDLEKWLRDLPTPTENVGFRAEQMIRCNECGRTSPPTRLKCLYCGAELEVSESQMQFFETAPAKTRILGKGFNLIVSPTRSDFDEPQLEEASKNLKIESSLLRKIIESGKSLPVARAESPKEAEIAQGFLRKLNVESFVLSDETLNAEKTPLRLRRIEFDAGKLILILFNRDEIVEIRKEDLALIVTGAIFERKIEATEKRRRSGENQILETTEITSDESLFDIYSRADAVGFRVTATGFDFSSLDAEKGFLAIENIKKLVEKLRRFAPNVKFVGDYLRNREMLANVWEVEQKTDSQGLKRESFRKFNPANVTNVNNTAQFTKYSRLHRNLL